MYAIKANIHIIVSNPFYRYSSSMKTKWKAVCMLYSLFYSIQSYSIDIVHLWKQNEKLYVWYKSQYILFYTILSIDIVYLWKQNEELYVCSKANIHIILYNPFYRYSSSMKIKWKAVCML